VATIRELERGVWLEETVPDDIRHEVESLCYLLSNCVTDLVVSLSMFEHAYITQAQTPSESNPEEWQSNVDRHRQREAELEAEHGVFWGQPDYFERHQAISEQARRDLLREKWAEQGGPEAYRRRLVFIHARSFVDTLALLQRSLIALCDYSFETTVAARLKQARDTFAAALPGLKHVRDSAEHGEDRVRGKAFGKKIATQPLINSFIHAPGGGVMITESLNNQHFGGTVADGTYAEVEVADATTEIARAAVQAVYDALPWRSGHRQFEPSQ
jgi:hypothetical protein